MTIHRLKETGEWIKSKKINPQSAYYYKYMMQQSQYSNFLPYANQQMYLNQSLQFPNQPQNFSIDPSQMMKVRQSLPQGFENNLNHVNYNNNEIQIRGGNFNFSPGNLNGKPLHTPEKPRNSVGDNEGSGQQHYDTAMEQVPLKKPKTADGEDIQTRFEFGNDNFNEKNNFKLGDKRSKLKDTNKEEAPVGIGGGLGGEEVQIDVFNDKPKKKRKTKQKNLQEKQKFLKKRQKYDPMKAIEKEKKKKQSKKKHKKSKSAFPKGFFKGKEEKGIEEENSDIESEEKSSKISSKTESLSEEKPQSKKKPEKEVKIKKESRSEKRKSRVAKKQHKPLHGDSDEGSPERRLDLTPNKEVKHKNKSKNKIAVSKQTSTKRAMNSSISTKSKSKNVQFQKLNWGNVPRKID